jgi:hypothetical protein
MLELVLTDKREDIAVIRIIRGDWEIYSPYVDGIRIDDKGEAIKGYTLNNVGWINVPFKGVIIISYGYLRGE